MLLSILVKVLTFSEVAISQTPEREQLHLVDLSWRTRIRETYLQFIESSLISCAKKCLKRKRCQSFNYSKELSFCELNYEKDGTRLSPEDSDMFIHSDISGWNDVIEDWMWTCENHNCTERETCTVKGLCKISDCGPAPDSPDNVVVLHKGHHAVDNGFYYRCKDGYLMRSINNAKLQSNIMPVQCLKTGQWEQPLLKCEEARMFDGHWYYFSTEPMSWWNAQTFCRSMNSHLVKLESETEINFIFKVLTEIDKWAWTGGNDIAQEGTWVWEVDNSDVGQNWYKGEPSHMYEDCIVLIHSMPGWVDYACKQETNFICEQ